MIADNFGSKHKQTFKRKTDIQVKTKLNWKKPNKLNNSFFLLLATLKLFKTNEYFDKMFIKINYF